MHIRANWTLPAIASLVDASFDRDWAESCLASSVSGYAVSAINAIALGFRPDSLSGAQDGLIMAVAQIYSLSANALERRAELVR